MTTTSVRGSRVVCICLGIIYALLHVKCCAVLWRAGIKVGGVKSWSFYLGETFFSVPLFFAGMRCGVV
jgi:hypothetical protein